MGEVIVLADDEADLRTIYAEILRREGHEVLEAADGNEALSLVLGRRPALLILDVWMPVSNGFDVIDRLRQHPEAANTRVVMFSNLGDAETQLETFSGGVTDYWVKGLPLQEFQAGVRRVLAETQPLQAAV